MTLPFTPTRLVGLDPGTTSGLLCLDLPTSWRTMDARVVGHRTITRTSSKKLSEAEKDIHFRLTLMHQLQDWSPEHVALENPRDISDGWGGGGRRIGTGFRLGVMYAMALTAIPPGTQIGTYLVRGNRSGKGWRGYAKKDTVYGKLRVLAGHIGLPTGLPDHLLDALGVAAHYCEQMEARDAET